MPGVAITTGTGRVHHTMADSAVSTSACLGTFAVWHNLMVRLLLGLVAVSLGEGGRKRRHRPGERSVLTQQRPYNSGTEAALGRLGMLTCHSQEHRHDDGRSVSRGARTNGRSLRALAISLGVVLALSPCVFATCGECTGSGSINRNDGNTNFRSGSTLQAGFAISISGTHPGTTVTVAGTATFYYQCNGTPGTLAIQLSGTYTIPANSLLWYPSNGQTDPTTYQGAATLPACGSGGVRIGYSGSTETFAFTVTADQNVTVNVRWHYRGTKTNGSLTSGGWSSALPVPLYCSACAPAIEVTKTASVTMAYVGDTITYSYTVTNSGDVQLTAVTLTDSRLGSIGLGKTTLAPGVTTTGSTQHVVVTGDLPGPLENTATARGTPTSGSAVTDTSSLVSVTLAPTLSLQILSGASSSFPTISGPGLFPAQNGTTLRVTSSDAGWMLSQGLSFVVPPAADTVTLERVFRISYAPYATLAGTTDILMSYALDIAGADFAGLPQGDYAITITFTATSGG
jgi:hypothetical protein